MTAPTPTALDVLNDVRHVAAQVHDAAREAQRTGDWTLARELESKAQRKFDEAARLAFDNTDKITALFALARSHSLDNDLTNVLVDIETHITATRQIAP